LSQATKKDKWIGYWGKHWTLERFDKIKPWQKVNHFPMSFEVGRKDKMYANYKRMKTKVGPEYKNELDFVPKTFLLPNEFKSLKLAFHESSSWIIKPPASARGIGIQVITKMSSLPKKTPLICSHYVSNPLLINGRKFDLRLYVLVSSFDPLKIYLYKNGLARFAGKRYSHQKSNRSRFVHLTNYSVSKKLQDKVKDEDPFFDGDSKFSMKDNKWTFDILKDYFKLQNIDFDKIMDRIEKIVITTIMSVHKRNSSGLQSLPNKNCCYELFGFDILLDSNLKAWLMEVNISPSMKSSCSLDFEVKRNLASDTFNLVGFQISQLESISQRFKDKLIAPRSYLSTKERQKQCRVMKGGYCDIFKDMTENDFKILAELEDEYQRKGDYIRLWPSVKHCDKFGILESPNYSDILVMEWISLCKGDGDAKRLLKLEQAHHTTKVVKMPSQDTIIN
jgi:tubulin polyglutamylase TTLL4